MPVAREPDHPKLTFVTPEETHRQARPLPSDEDMAIEGLTDEEWAAFEKALADT